MSGRPAARLSDEDRVLWSLVARTAKPLKGRAAVEVPPEPPQAPMAQPAAPSMLVPPSHPAPRQHVSQALDHPTLDKLAAGRLPIEGRVDLHGMTQSEAQQLLLSFLQRAHAAGVRYVLVITGKGARGEGVLKRQVPAWLSTPPFRSLVSSHDHAARKHGGGGALYVRLRRKAG